MFVEGQSTRHETDIISHFALVAVGYANITNELLRFPKLIKRPPRKNKGAYLRRKGIDHIRGQGFGELKKQYYGELEPW
jgi:hypothetical protein